MLVHALSRFPMGGADITRDYPNEKTLAPISVVRLDVHPSVIQRTVLSLI